jgi:outer membrane protein TolC
MNRFALAAVLSLALAGCRAPGSPIDPRFLEVLEWAGRDDVRAAHEPSAPVWKGVEDRKALTPADAFRITLTQSERIARAAEGYLQSLTLKDQAIAAMLPTVGVQATSFFQDKVKTSTSSSFFTTTGDQQELRLTVTQPIFHGLQQFAGWRQSQAAIEQSRAFFETERRLLFQVVAQAFYNTLFLERQLKILEDAVKNSRERLREMQARQAQGIARKTEVLLIETQVASDESQLARGRQALDVARTQMAFLLGKPVAVPLLDDLLEPGVPADPAPLLQEALAARSDLRDREAAVRVAEENRVLVSSEHLPSVDFTGNVYAWRRNFSDVGQDTDWDALFTLTFNLFKGGGIRAREVAAESQTRVARLNRDELVRQIETDVKGALLTWRSDQDLIKTLETGARTSEENYRQVISEYRQGIAGVSNLEVLVAQNQFLAAQLELERQKIQSKLDWFQLENARGRVPVR